jgi:predicted nucleotidyltransferase
MEMIADSHARHVIDDIVTRLKKEYRPEKIILFGSYAYGQPTRDSDIDLFIIKDTAESPFQRRITVRRICYAPDHRIPFQPLVVTPSEWSERLEVGDPFFREIQSRGEILYAKRERVTCSKRLVRESRARYETRGRAARDQRRRRRRVSSPTSR